MGPVVVLALLGWREPSSVERVIGIFADALRYAYAEVLGG